MKLSLTAAVLGLALTLAPRAQEAPATPFARALAAAEKALAEKDLPRALAEVQRAQERDPRSVAAWDLRARWAEAAGERDELVYALHRSYQLTVAQGLRKKERQALEERLFAVDGVARDLFGLKDRFVSRLEPLAAEYEKDHRPHSAIRVHKEILALDPERATSSAAIERLAAAPDPSLAVDAKPKDLLAGVDEQWIAEHDRAHDTWEKRAKLERENYTTHTDAGYEVLVRASEAMEQMNAFYRQFFRYGEDGKGVGRIDLQIYKTRDEYLKLGSGPPVEWSGGQFTGGSVETYIGQGGFEEMTGTLFHEAAHQFVSLSTNATGWLNEGLASFFEGCRILSNGTVIMNLPANHRLFPLVERMEKGWMSSVKDGFDPADPEKEPEKAPTFRIVLEDEYGWGPPWYAPTWGLVYFLYNFEDPADGRFVYRDAFRTFIDASGGRSGEGAVTNFEEVVLAHPKAPTKGVESSLAALPATVDELNAVWKDWLVKLEREISGKEKVDRPYLTWGRCAVARGDLADAAEHFEKGINEHPDDDVLLAEFATLLGDKLGNPDRATKLVRQALGAVETRQPVVETRLDELEKLLVRFDPKQKTLVKVRADLVRESELLVQRYLGEGLNLQAMDLARRMANDFQATSMQPYFEEAARRSHKSLAMWRLAYNEVDLDGWAEMGNETFAPDGEVLKGAFKGESEFDFRFLVLDEITSGDFSMEAEVGAEKGRVSFCGLVFGRKTSTDFHAAILFPPGFDEQGAPVQGFVDLTTFYGDASFDIWRHTPVQEKRKAAESASDAWRKLRLDVTGRNVDVWLDGEFVATQEFGSLGVLRGTFGLILGPGEARFRNVRYLARDARDPGSLIERELRMESIAGSGGSRGYSWAGAKPPFPQVARWVGPPRTSWEEKLGYPQLFVLWSIGQNDQIRLDEWLAQVQKTHAGVGLQIVSVVNTWDADKLDAYLKGRPFPGSVGVDLLDKPKGTGKTYEDFFVSRFNLPRILIVDVDGTVAWEGDPGFKIGHDWRAGEESYVDAPLQELVTKRRLQELAQWRASWEAAKQAMARGDFAGAAPALMAAKELDWRVDPQVLEARTRLNALLTTLDDAATFAQGLAADGREAALEALARWGSLAGAPLDLEAKELKPFAKSECAREWTKALAALKPQQKKLEEGKEPGRMQGAYEKLDALRGAFPRELAAELRAAEAAGPEKLAAALRDADRLPERWLARERFGW
jgi:Tfp pilus assembly protein PilF